MTFTKLNTSQLYACGIVLIMGLLQPGAWFAQDIMEFPEWWRTASGFMSVGFLTFLLTIPVAILLIPFQSYGPLGLTFGGALIYGIGGIILLKSSAANKIKYYIVYLAVFFIFQLFADFGAQIEISRRLAKLSKPDVFDAMGVMIMFSLAMFSSLIITALYSRYSHRPKKQNL